MSAEDEFFGIVLDELGPNEMVNQAMEITLLDAEGGFELVPMPCRRYSATKSSRTEEH